MSRPTSLLIASFLCVCATAAPASLQMEAEPGAASATPEDPSCVTWVVEGMMKSRSGAT